MPDTRVSETPTAFAVICPEHDQVYLTDEEYQRQLVAADVVWVCPQCGDDADFDDDNYEKFQGVTSVEEAPAF